MTVSQLRVISESHYDTSPCTMQPCHKKETVNLSKVFCFNKSVMMESSSLFQSMIVLLLVLRKTILSPEYWVLMFDCVFVDDCLGHVLLQTVGFK